MRVFLGNAPWKKNGHYGVRAGSRWPHFERDESRYMPFPFQLAYAAALLEQDGINVLLVDGIGERMSDGEFLERIRLYGPDLVLLEVSTISIDVDMRFVREARRIIGPGCKIALCGLHAFMREPRFFDENPDVDFALVGEYEFTLLGLAKALESGGNLSGVPGLLYRAGDGKVEINPPRPLVDDVDCFPWPSRHFLPMDKYHDDPWQCLPEPCVQMWATRGCPFNCIFCCWPQIMYGSNKYRMRDPMKVVDEMEWLVKEKGFKSVYFDDDTFNINKRFVLAICSEIKKRKLNVPWAIMARADTMDREMLIALREAGLVALKYGVESASQRIVDGIGKKLDLKKVKKVVKMTRKMGIKYHLTFMFGLPGETKRTMRKNIRMALKLDPDSVQFSIATPFPGSRYFNMLDEKGYILSRNWEEYDGYNTAVIRTEKLSARDLEEGRWRAVEAWNEHVKKRSQGRT